MCAVHDCYFSVLEKIKQLRHLSYWECMSRMTKWMHHVDAISSKMSSRLYFLKQLKRSNEDLLYFYTTAIRPVLEYACPVWHSSFTVAQTKALELLQQRAMKIIFPYKEYNWFSLIGASADTLESRREQLTERSSKGAFYRNRPAYTIPAPGQTRLKHHRQTSLCENIYIILH